MILNREAVAAMLLERCAAAVRAFRPYSVGDRFPLWRRRSRYYDEQDRPADYRAGTTVGRPFHTGFLEDLGMAAMEVRGGSAGPLYGALISGLGVLLEEDENELDEGGLRRMFAGILQELGILPRQKWETRP